MNKEITKEKEPESREWIPRTSLGKRVAAGEVTSLEQVYSSGAKILEPEIVDRLLPDLKEDVLEVKNTQRMTAYGRKMMMRAVVILGNQSGCIAVGTGKAPESRDAIAEAIRDAKKHVVFVPLGCGSWECRCELKHSVMRKVTGKSSSTSITLKPAPKGVGIVAGATAKKVLELAGVKDVWSFSKGRTRNVLNMVNAVIDGLNKLNRLKIGVDANE